ncbi:MAG TPA: 50S ribosomal protein L18 [candidate division Zixibacteria bacterium]|nr:50S ribosomal protein L18 [candidate division Zixibacteria bacterium]
MLGNERYIGRVRRRKRVRKKVLGTDERPRLCVFRSNKHIYAQVISDDRGVTLASASTLASAATPRPKGVEAARQVGLEIARICKERNITRVVFDRNGFLYHGQVKALADGAREGGLEF